jgi:hypothetical protein
MLLSVIGITAGSVGGPQGPTGNNGNDGINGANGTNGASTDSWIYNGIGSAPGPQNCFSDTQYYNTITTFYISTTNRFSVSAGAWLSAMQADVIAGKYVTLYLSERNAPQNFGIYQVTFSNLTSTYYTLTLSPITTSTNYMGGVTGWMNISWSSNGLNGTGSVSGTVNTIAKFTGLSTVGNSSITDDGAGNITVISASDSRLWLKAATGSSNTILFNRNNIANYAIGINGSGNYVINSYNQSTGAFIGEAFGIGSNSTNISLGSLVGSGTRMVVASATGQLSTQAISTAPSLQAVTTVGATTTNDIYANNFIIQPAGYNVLASLSRNLTGSGYGVLSLRNGAIGTIQPLTLGVDRTYYLPNANGTIALTNDLTGYVTLATIQTISGSKTFTNSLIVGDTSTVVFTEIGQNYIDIHNGNDISTGWIRHVNNGFSRFKNSLSTNLVVVDPIANTTLNLPAKSAGTYTIATLEDLGNYVTLAGASQTITGRKELNNSVNGISLNFSITGTGTGINMTSTSTGYGINCWNQSTGAGIRNLTTGSGNGIQAASDGAGTALYVLNSANSTGTGLLIFNNTTATGMPLVVQKNSVDKFTVSDNGTVTAATGFFVSSDTRLKDIIERDGDTVKFTWKDKRDEKVHIGYIAQEVQEKYPDQVNESSDGMLTVNYIEILVAKIQELENRIKQLEK